MDPVKTSLLEMQASFEQRMATFEADLQSKCSGASSLATLAEDFASFKTLTLTMLKSLHQQVEVIARAVDNMETYSRRKILLLHGVKELREENTSQVVATIIREKLQHLSFTPDELSRCHRMGRTTGEKCRPIIVKFRSLTMRDSIWSSKSKLKGSGTTLSEFLTRIRHTAFMAAREKYGVDKCWSREGCVYVLAPDGSRHRIASLKDLNELVLNKSKVTNAETTVAAKDPPPSSRQRRAAAASKK